MSVYQTLWRSFAPPWYQTAKNIGVFYESIGALLDSEAQRSLDARLAGIVYAGAEPFAAKLADGRRIECQPDALPFHSVDRKIQLYPTEGVLSQRIRLSQWWQLHAERGQEWGIVRHVRPYFADFVAAGGAYPTISLVYQTNEGTPAAIWYRVDPTGARSITRNGTSNWNLTDEPVKRSRFAAIIHLPPEWTSYRAASWDGSDVWDGDALWDGIPAAVSADLYAMIADWKAAHTWLWAVILTTLQPGDDIPGHTGRHPFDPTDTAITLTDGSTSLPVGNWGTSVYTSGASLGLPTRPSWALFLNPQNG